MRSRTLIYAAFLVLLTLAACGDPNPDSTFDPDTGKHPAAWLPAQHATAASSGTTTLGTAIPALDPCTECHGADLTGGIATVSCTTCHLGGPASAHPTDWFPIVLTHGPSVSSGATTEDQCANQYCHGATLAGVTDSGPSCALCHTWPFTPGSIVCGSCHGLPPDGSRFPDVAGRHLVHTAFTGTTLSDCSICHSGSDGVSGSNLHYDLVVDVAILAAYDAKTGAAAYLSAGQTCSQVSCHGGQTTPNWQSGSIDVNSQCRTCHAYGTTQYNSFSSGEHSKHVNGEGISCTECHDTTKLATVHFNDLDTPAMDQAPLSLRDALNYTGTAGAPAAGTCTINCHGENHTNRSW